MPRAASAAVLLLFLAASVRCSVKTCDQGQVWARGRELINAMKGQLVLVAFPNANDRATLQKLSSLAESHPSIRVIALLDPSSCSTEEASKMERDWRWLVVDRDDLSSRQRLGLNQGDVALFDRCGRLSRSLSLAATEELNKAMRGALHHANCGWCQYNTESGGEGGRVDKKLDAFFQQAIATQSPTQQRVYPHRAQQQQMQHQHAQQNQQNQGNQQHDPRQQAAYEEQLRQYHQRTQQQNQQSLPSYRNQQQSMGQTPGHITHSQIRPHEYAHRGMTIPQHQTVSSPTTTQSSDDYGDYEDVMKLTTTKTKEVDLRKPAFNEDAQWATASPFHQRRQHKDLFAVPPPTTFSEPSPNYESAARKGKPSVFTTTAESKKAGAGFEDYADYEDYGAMKTFTNNDVQEEEQVVHVARSTQSRPRSVDPRGYEPDGQEEDEVPCKAITDDICYHQKKSGRKLSKCCKKGIYLADFCLPGKCSNTTVQACCMQKYLQAKFQCCENAEMEGTTATDAFSRCCHAHFTEEDDCCPPETAGEYWQSVHDICLPNVKADLSTVRFEIRLSDGIRVLDMAEPDKWQHECRYGGRRAQYVYVP